MGKTPVIPLNWEVFWFRDQIMIYIRKPLFNYRKPQNDKGVWLEHAGGHFVHEVWGVPCQTTRHP